MRFVLLIHSRCCSLFCVYLCVHSSFFLLEFWFDAWLLFSFMFFNKLDSFSWEFAQYSQIVHCNLALFLCTSYVESPVFVYRLLCCESCLSSKLNSLKSVDKASTILYIWSSVFNSYIIFEMDLSTVEMIDEKQRSLTFKSWPIKRGKFKGQNVNMIVVLIVYTIWFLRFRWLKLDF